MEDFRQALYAAKLLDKVQSAHVSAMATIGNEAAHGKPVKDEDAERLLRDVRAFISSTSGS